MAGAAKGSAKQRHAESRRNTDRDEKSTIPPKASPRHPLDQSPKSNKTSGSNTSSSGKASSSAKSPSAHTLGKPSTRGFDGNRDPSEQTVAPALPQQLKNLDLAMGAWAYIRGTGLTELPRRPPPSTLGQPSRTGVNAYNIAGLPTSRVHQYDIIIGNGAEKRGLVEKVWASKELAKQLGARFIFDGNRLAWSMNKLDREIRCVVDLDAESGRPARPGGNGNSHRVVVRYTNTIDFTTLNEYMDGKVTFSNKILEAINFLDHLLREWPRTKYSAIKRSFFYTGPDGRFDLGEGIEALKGVYQSMRIVHAAPGKARLSINVDVANGTFWNSGLLTDLAVKFVGVREIGDIASAILKAGGQRSRTTDNLKRMRKIHVEARHRHGHVDSYVIDKFLPTSAENYKIEKDGKSMSLIEYYKSQHGVNIKHRNLPLVQMTRRNAVLPMELLHVKVNQRYPFKLSDRQTQKMITFAVEPPQKRMEAIRKGLDMLSWSSDPCLRAHGLKVDSQHAVVNSRLLQAPTVKFGQGEAKPGTSGRWDLRGKKFLQPNAVPLKSWAVCVATGRRSGKPDRAAIENFVREFVKTYMNHGGRVENKSPAMSLATGDDVATWVTNAWNAAGNQTQSRPQILIFILPDKDSLTYGRIKRSCECRYGVVSQCMQYGQVQKCNGQYMSNVCMKFNAKLGGVTCRAIGPKTGGPGGAFLDKTTLVIGADVSHGAPGSAAASMAAITVSLDRLATRYAAVCQTNGFRNEMIHTETFNSDVKPHVQRWMNAVNSGKLPDRVIYMRDGVSEGQYSHVLQQEVHDLREMMKSMASGPNFGTKFIAVVAGKRHHIRFFPEQGKGDRNGNPLPGTLVETGVTHPFENDFYLCSHAAIKGTARPVHYHVILNEANVSNEELQTLLYEHSYQYIRATTPVSIHSAIYYAHIASQRAIPHDPKWTGSVDSPSSNPPKGPQSQGKSGGKSGSSSGPTTEVDKLMPMPDQGQIVSSMWYI